MIIIDSFLQGSPEWFAACAGNPGASNADKIITTKGERSKQRDDYMRQLAGEFITGKKEETFTSQAMINGMEREASSRQLFEMIYGVEVKQCGLVYKDDKRLFHCSPDGLMADSGLELKNPMIKTQVKYLLEKVFPMDYYQQIQFSLYVTGFKLWYFMSSYEGLPPFIIECRRDEKFISALAYELDAFTNELQDMINRLQDQSGIKEVPKAAPKGKNGPATTHQEELAPGECPLRPDTTMTKNFCGKCKDRLGCSAWEVKFKAVGE